MNKPLLLVDDDPSSDSLVKNVIRSANEYGFSVEHCQTADDAVDLICSERFAAVLIDWKLRHGWKEAVRCVQATCSWQGCKWAVLTRFRNDPNLGKFDNSRFRPGEHKLTIPKPRDKRDSGTYIFEELNKHDDPGVSMGISLLREFQSSDLHRRWIDVGPNSTDTGLHREIELALRPVADAEFRDSQAAWLAYAPGPLRVIGAGNRGPALPSKTALLDWQDRPSRPAVFIRDRAPAQPGLGGR